MSVTKIRPAKPGPNRAAKRHPVAAKAKPAQKRPADKPAPAPQTDQLPTPQEVAAYATDSWQRYVLFLDALRQRGDNMLDHDAAGMPPLLDFKYETILDARHFEVPVNYALLRIIEFGDDCWDDCVDPDKPPVIVIDPRAGHGPGIGGFKHESEVGIALHEGHPVYFVIFYPQPEPGQTLADVHFTLRRFVDEVASRHPGKPPVLYGNCQAGWAVTLLAADCEGVSGVAVLNGSPLSYWAGESGVNPMRISGGLVGGAWLVNLLGDLGNGTFDGAWLAQNFENLQPEKTHWEKYANLWANIDSERERFLDFERWWGGFYSLSREEILTIAENLFIGNKLEQGNFPIHGECRADLRRIASPLVIFASYGDNITPPQQALGWIPVVYKDTADLKSAGQRIVYLTNPHVGHLGLFVSARTARLEHRAILESLEEIEALAPGLYEMKIDNPTGDPDCSKDQYHVRFEEREVKDIPAPQQNKAFEKVRETSRVNQSLYKSFVSPWVQLAANPWGSEMMKWAHPMRSSRALFSERVNPWMAGIGFLAAGVSLTRKPLAPDNPLRQREKAAIAEVSQAIKTARQERDSASEALFEALYGGLDAASDNSEAQQPKVGTKMKKEPKHAVDH